MPLKSCIKVYMGSINKNKITYDEVFPKLRLNKAIEEQQ